MNACNSLMARGDCGSGLSDTERRQAQTDAQVAADEFHPLAQWTDALVHGELRKFNFYMHDESSPESARSGYAHLGFHIPPRFRTLSQLQAAPFEQGSGVKKQRGQVSNIKCAKREKLKI